MYYVQGVFIPNIVKDIAENYVQEGCLYITKRASARARVGLPSTQIRRRNLDLHLLVLYTAGF